KGRQHELRTGLEWALDSILTRVERGMTVEIRFLPPPEAAAGATGEAGEAGDATGRAFETLKEIAPQLTFPPPEPVPIRPLPPPPRASSGSAAFSTSMASA